MSGGWERSDRRARLPEDWEERRRFVLQRDSYTCRASLPSGKRCLRPATDVDHVHRGDDHSYGNLQALCAYHHAKKTAREGGQAKRRPPKKRPREEHPGRRR